MEFPQHIIFAFLLTILAGLSTGIGSAIAYFIKKPKMIYLSFSLGFSAGVVNACLKSDDGFIYKNEKRIIS